MKKAARKSIFTRLSGVGAVTSLLATGQPGGVTAIFSKIAPAGAKMPYIVYDLAGGGDEHETRTPSGDMVWYIKAVAKSQSAAETIAEAIYDALEEQQAVMTIDTPWEVERIQRTLIITQHETVENEQIYYEGGGYRLRLAQ